MEQDKTLNKIALLTTSYYSQLSENDYTENNYKLWIESLKEPMKSHFKDKGFQNCKGVVNFQRFILELKDESLDEYIKQRLTNEEYIYWTNS